MAQAIKCDRCKKFCDYDEVENYKARMITHGGGAYTVRKLVGEDKVVNYSCHSVDLCTSCLNELKLFIENGSRGRQ